MKAAMTLLAAGVILTGCSWQNNNWSPVNEQARDQKSYAIGYEATMQTYSERVDEHFDTTSFMRGVNEWYNKKMPLPVEQIRASIMNRMLDHSVYVYYSGALYAAELQGRFNYLDQNCWNLVQPDSISAGIFAAMQDLKNNTKRDDAYIQNGLEELSHLCVKTVAEDEKKARQTK